MEYPQNNNGRLEYNDNTQSCEVTIQMCPARIAYRTGCPGGWQEGPEVCRKKITEYVGCKSVCNDIGAVNWSPSNEGDGEQPTTFTFLSDESISDGCYQKIDKPESGGPSSPSLHASGAVQGLDPEAP